MSEESEKIKEYIKSIYIKYSEDKNKLDLIEKEIKDILVFLRLKKEEIEYKKILQKNKK